jgi:low temperature requirement protein LtrA
MPFRQSSAAWSRAKNHGGMRQIFRSRPVMTEETHRATAFEIFFDLVLIFALTRVTSFIAASPSFLRLLQGLLLLLLLWWSWSAYTWLANQARADRGVIRAGGLVAMAAIFVAAMVMPDAWQTEGVMVDAPVTLALAYVVVRVVYLALYLYLYLYTAIDDRRLRIQLLLSAIPQSLAWIALILGALLGPTGQTVLWAVALVIDFGGGRLASALSGWALRSPSHFAERHSLVLIIALGESLISIGAGAGTAVTSRPVLVAALLGLTSSVCLWWLYFENVAPAAGRALARAPTERRPEIAREAYTLVHLPLVTGVIYLAFGIEEALAAAALRYVPGAPLSWPAATAMYGGVALYLAGRAAFLRLTVGSATPAQLVAAAAALALLPAVRSVPALAALGLITVLLVGLVALEWLTRERAEPAGPAAPAAPA